MVDLILNIFSSEVNIVFAVLIGVLLVLSLWNIYKSKHQAFTFQAPSVLTTLGILGTFIGIFKGLYEFDVANIDGSIPNLLEGLKIAFVTSILGMISAIIVKWFLSVKADQSKKVEGVTPEDIYHILEELKNIQAKTQSENREILIELKKSISSDQDTSLVTQIQKLRLSIEESLKALREDFGKFAEKVAQDNTEALIRALEEVIRDFNAKINEQFGENFKQLNEAVGAMLDWQKEYKSQVEALNEMFRKSVENIQKVETSIKDIELSIAEIQNKLALVPETLKSIEGIVRIISNETEELDEHLAAFSDLKKEAQNAFPIIKENLDHITQELNKIVVETIEAISITLEDFGSKLKDLAEKHDASITTSLENMTQHINQALEQANDLLKQAFAAFDTQMQEEVERTISALGSGLASLSNKFVEDYTPLTDKLREVVRIAERITERQRA